MVSLTNRGEAFTVKLPTFCRSYEPEAFECCFALNKFVLKLSHIASVSILEPYLNCENCPFDSGSASCILSTCQWAVDSNQSCKWLSLGLQIGFISTSFFWLFHSHVLLKTPSLGLWKFKFLWIWFFNLCFGKSSEVKFEVFLWSDIFWSKVIIHLLPFMISKELGNVCIYLNSIHFYRLAKGRYGLWNRIQNKDY